MQKLSTENLKLNKEMANKIREVLSQYPQWLGADCLLALLVWKCHINNINKSFVLEAIEESWDIFDNELEKLKKEKLKNESI
jgi:hypothetical protein